MPIEKIPLDKSKNGGISAIYRSDITRELDRVYNMNGTPLTNVQIKNLVLSGSD